MTVTLELEPELDSHLRAVAEAEGVSVEQYLRRLIADAVHGAAGEPALALLQRWAAEDATDDAEEIARRERDWAAFREGLNRSHSSNRVLFP
jgi:hypothetical protein